MPNYENGKVYCIRSHATDGCYIGSTIQPLSKRFHAHKRDYNKWLKDNLRYTTSYKILEHGIDDCYIELIENVSCNDKKELERREGEIMRITDNCVNRNIMGRTKKEYREDNKEKLKEQSKKWSDDNKEKLKEKSKKWYEDNKEYAIEQNRMYNQGKKENIKEYNRIYREVNKEKIKEKKAIKYSEKKKAEKSQ